MVNKRLVRGERVRHHVQHRVRPFVAKRLLQRGDSGRVFEFYSQLLGQPYPDAFRAFPILCRDNHYINAMPQEGKRGRNPRLHDVDISHFSLKVRDILKGFPIPAPMIERVK